MRCPPVICSECTCEFPASCDRCPHCARPSLFPNVRAAELSWEREALEERYTRGVAEAASRHADATLAAFESELARSHAVIARDIHELMRLTTSDREVYASYYELTDSGIRIPAGDRWDVLRVATDQALFPGYKERIRFAALALDAEGLARYGNCSLVLRDSMIAHRASVFEENSVMWMVRRSRSIDDLDSVEPGFRATWPERARLAVAKLAGKLEPDTSPDLFPRLLLSCGPAGADDEYVEVHVYGPLTVRALAQVKIRPPRTKRRAVLQEAVLELLAPFGVEVH